MNSRAVLFVIFLGCFVLLLQTSAQIRAQDDYGEEVEVECANNTDCTDHFGEESECVQEVCHCKDGAHYDHEAVECVLIHKHHSGVERKPPPPPPPPPSTARFPLGHHCVANENCNAVGSVCLNTSCVCPKDFTPSTNRTKCLPLARELGWGCEETVQCTTLLNRTTECVDFTCMCKRGTQEHDGKCVESKGLDGFCESSAVCTTEHAECSQGICACASGYLTAADNKRCIEVTRVYKGPCEESAQCSMAFGDNSVCVNAECVCRPGHHFASHLCLMDKGLRDQCEESSECYSVEDGDHQKLECASGQCICREGYEPDLKSMRCSGVSMRGGSTIVVSVSPLLLVLLARLLAV